MVLASRKAKSVIVKYFTEGSKLNCFAPQIYSVIILYLNTATWRSNDSSTRWLLPLRRRHFKTFWCFPFFYNCVKEQNNLTGFLFVFVLMKSKHSLITFIFSSFRKSNVFRRMEEDGFWSREDTWIAEFLVDTAKIRPLKLLSNTSENGGSYKV